MGLAGTKMHDPNFKLRILLILLGGTMAFASILYWRTELFASQEYIEFSDRNNITATRKPAEVNKSQGNQNPVNKQNKVRRDLQGHEDLF